MEMMKKQEEKENALRKRTPCMTGQQCVKNKIGRRDFIKGSLAITGSVLGWSLFGSPEKALAQDLTGNPERFGMLTDITRCIGCRRCEAACNKANSLPPPLISFGDTSVFQKERRTDAQTYEVVNRYTNPKTGLPVYRKVQCNHCAEPACVSACPVGALKKSQEGPVIYNEKICIGCRYCMTACPFSIPCFEYFDARSPAIQKCFMCYHLIVKGEMPACAVECPMGAITFGKKKELLKIARNRIQNEPNKYIDHIYGETEAGGTDWLYISGVPFEAMGFPDNLGTTPYPELTHEFLSAVPLVLMIWPALLGGLYLFSKKQEQANNETAQGKEAQNDE
jgi:formate dehydrogenase iron-sulfur subunit